MSPSPLLQRRQVLFKYGSIPRQLLLPLPNLNPLQDLLFGRLQLLHSLQDEGGQIPGGRGVLNSPVPPRSLLPERFDLPDSVLQPLQPQAELQLLLPPVEAQGQVVVLGQSRAGSAAPEDGPAPRGAREGGQGTPTRLSTAAFSSSRTALTMATNRSGSRRKVLWGATQTGGVRTCHPSSFLRHPAKAIRGFHNQHGADFQL